ncbi:MAG: 50S ribosomal protein L4 [Clostridia bacterium]
MPTVPIVDMQGEQTGEVELDPFVWNSPENGGLIHQAVVTYLANQRTGSASTRTRAEVRGGGRKPWRQKGLGRARHGSIRSPIWTGGGVVFGPKPRSYRKRMNKKARRGALRAALSSSVRDSEITLIDSIDLPGPKTGAVRDMLRDLGLSDKKKILFVTSGKDDILLRSSRNLPGMRAMRAQDLNTYMVMDSDHLVITKDALPVIEEVLGNG